MLKNSRVYHHTKEVNLNEDNQWGIIEFAAEDKNTAMLGVFTLGEIDKDKTTRKVKFKGLDSAKNYALYCNDVFVGNRSGFELTQGFECEIKIKNDAKCFIATKI